jgi:monoamine oxidase
MKKIIIIGAGLTGLYTAYLLKNKYEVTIIEARNRIGGRILTQDGHDLGPSWVWSHQKNILALIRSFNLELFSQYSYGLALYQTPNTIERFTPAPSAPQARLVGGITSLIQAIVNELDGVKIILNEEVSVIENIEEAHKTSIKISTKKEIYVADRVIMTLPPRVALNVDYRPTLDDKSIKVLRQTPTWMGHSRKCVIEFKTPFWRETGLSGFCFSPKGVLGEIHDATTQEKAALFGFVNSTVDDKDIEQRVIHQLVKLFGEEVKSYTNFYDVSWRDDGYSAVKEDRSMKEHPKYGYEISAYSDRLHFLSTESSFEGGGYLEGSIIVAKEMAKKLWFCDA